MELEAAGPSSEAGVGMIALRGRVLVSVLGGVLVLVAVAAALAWRQYEDSRSSALNQARARAVLAVTVFDTYFAGQIANS